VPGTGRMSAAVESRPGASVLICLLGGFRLLKRGTPLPVRPGGRTEALLATLALAPAHGIRRDELVEQLWPATEPQLGIQALRTLAYSLHQSLGDALGGMGPIINTDGRYRLNAEAGVDTDVERFDSVVDTAERLARSGAVDDAVRRYRDAVGMYQGDLVVGSEIRHLLERERLRTRFIAARTRLAEYHVARQEHDEALANVLEILRHDPFREDAHRLAMRCYVLLGQRAQALRQYRICRDVLQAEFEAPPERATDELYETIRLDPTRI
jgi:DNA-binding SARP family transcriptional activator